MTDRIDELIVAPGLEQLKTGAYLLWLTRPSWKLETTLSAISIKLS
jgi:hypothetical protein